MRIPIYQGWVIRQSCRGTLARSWSPLRRELFVVCCESKCQNSQFLSLSFLSYKLHSPVTSVGYSSVLARLCRWHLTLPEALLEKIHLVSLSI